MLLETTKTYYRQNGKWVIDEDAQSELDYSYDLRLWLEKVGDTLASWEPVYDPAELTIINQSNDDYTMSVFLKFTAPPVVGQLYAFTYRFTTNNNPPRKDDRTIYIKAVKK